MLLSLNLYFPLVPSSAKYAAKEVTYSAWCMCVYRHPWVFLFHYDVLRSLWRKFLLQKLIKASPVKIFSTFIQFRIYFSGQGPTDGSN